MRRYEIPWGVLVLAFGLVLFAVGDWLGLRRYLATDADSGLHPSTGEPEEALAWWEEILAAMGGSSGSQEEAEEEPGVVETVVTYPWEVFKGLYEWNIGQYL